MANLSIPKALNTLESIVEFCLQAVKAMKNYKGDTINCNEGAKIFNRAL